MAFQFLRDKSQNLTLILVGDIDLEVTPDIKAQLASQLDDAASLQIDCKNISYLDSSGVSVLIIAMQSCKQKRINLRIRAISDEAMRVLQLAKLEKILPIEAITGPAELVDIDVFSNVGPHDASIADEVGANFSGDFGGGRDDDLIAALANGDMADAVTAQTEVETEVESEVETEVEAEVETEAASESEVEPDPTPHPPAPHPPTPEAVEPQETQAQPRIRSGSAGSSRSGGGGAGNNFKPGTF